MGKEFHNLKTGVIGVGSMGQNHARVYSELSDLVAVSDLDEEQGKKVAKKFGVKWYANYEDMLDEVDAVTVAVPTSNHLEVAKKVSSYGVNMLIEKPLAGNYKDGKEIVQLMSASNLVLAVGHIERHNEVVNYSKSIIDSGEWGNILAITARRFSNLPHRIHDVGVMFDLSIHDVDIISYLVGDKVSNIFAMGGKALNKKYEDYVTLSMEFVNGTMGVCETNWLTPMKVRDISIKTDKCYVEIDYIDQEIVVSSSEYEKVDETNLYKTKMAIKQDKISLPKKEPLKNEIIDFLDCLILKKQPLVTGVDALNAIKIIEAGLKSMKTKKSIRLDV